MIAGIGLGKLLPGAIASLRGVEFGHGSQINAPIAVLIWLMITPMMMKVDFSSVKNVRRRPAGLLLRSLLVRSRGRAWFEGVLLPKFAPVTIAALLGTLVLIFAFQADNITGRFSHVVLIAIPITLQVYLNAGLAYGLMKWLKVEHSVAAPGALIGASNFFELAVATAIRLIRAGIRRGAGDGRRRSGRSAGDAVRLRGLQSYPALVSC